jgi:hypothetical protein
MTLLSICQEVVDELGLERPTTVIGSSDRTARRLLALAQEEGRRLNYPESDRYWEQLVKEYTFNTADGTQAYSLPTDFKYFINDTWWDRTEDRKLVLFNPRKWQSFVSSDLGLTGINTAFRLRGNEILLHPTPTSVRTLSFEYVTTEWCESSGGTGQSTWQADTDVPVLDEEFYIHGIRWRLKRSLGMAYEEDLRIYQNLINRALAKDGGSGCITFNARYDDEIMGNLPETIPTS